MELETLLQESSRCRQQLAWHKNQWQLVTRAQRANKMPHALMLTGSRGMGKHQFAIRLVNLVLCYDKSESDRACQSCSSCKLFINQTHPDFIAVTPASDAKSIKIEQIRSLHKRLNQSRLGVNPKVVMISLVEQMNLAASNALLKLLEEPPGECFFILISQNQQAIPATIISRCQRWHFNALSQKEFAAYNLNFSPDKLGAPLASEPSIKPNEIALSLSTVFANELSPITLAELWLKLDFKSVLTALYFVLMDVIKVKLNITPCFIKSSSEFDSLCLSLPLLQLFHVLDEIYAIMLKLFHNIVINQQLSLENLLIGLLYDE